MDPILTDLDRLLDAPSPDYEAVLAAVLERFDCVTGTIHRLDPESGLLALVAQRGIPDAILERVRRIPIGKGMAGIAAERREPVQVCNLQTDASGVARPAARETRMAGSVACPALAGDELRGTLGIAKPTEYEFGADEIALLRQVAGRLAARLP